MPSTPVNAINEGTDATAPRYRIKTGLFALAFLALATLIAWPIYQTPFYLVTVAVAIAGGALLAWLRIRQGWGLVTTALIALAAYLVLCLPVTNPSALASGETLLRGWIESVSGIIFSWKQLVTIEPPVGTYHALLVPAFLVFYVATLLALSVLWHSNRRNWLALIPLVAASIFGLAFGGSTANGPLRFGDVVVPVSTGVAFGVALLILSVSFLSWSASNLRRAGMIVASSAASTLGTSSRLQTPRSRVLRRAFAALGVVVAAAVVGTLVLSVTGIAATREVLRTAVNPKETIEKELSPLSSYRLYFEDEALLEKSLLTFTSDSATPGNIRLAVMPYFDGQVFTVTPPGDEQDESVLFSRLPMDLSSTTGTNETYETQIAVTGLANIWAPLMPHMKSVTFTGAQAGALTDAFFFNRSTNAGALVPGPNTGATYTLRAFAPGAQGRIEDLAAGTTSSGLNEKVLPPSLIEWLELQKIDGSTGPGLKAIVEKLRARGYLSHSLQAPTSADGAPTWRTLLPGYKAFEPSLAGHSTGRLEKLFAALVARQKATTSTSDADLVAAAGDDEQFAAAVALIASHYGYASRVVVGFRSTPTSDTGYTVPNCQAGTCTGGNLAAWVEVAGANGAWVSLDVTPQYKNVIAPKSQDRQDPKNETSVTEDAATVLPPAQANPANGATKPKDQAFVFDLTWLLEILKTVGTGALILGVLASPFVLVIGAKVRRRRERRNAADTSVAIMGAWEEFVDSAVDSGKPLPKHQTRSELAALYVSDNGAALATLADEAAFAPYEPKASAVVASWQLVDDQRADARAGASRWRQFAQLMSLRSFVRYIQPKEQIRRIQGAFAFSHENQNSSVPTFWAFMVFLARLARELALKAWHWLRARLHRSRD